MSHYFPRASLLRLFATVSVHIFIRVCKILPISGRCHSVPYGKDVGHNGTSSGAQLERESYKKPCGDTQRLPHKRKTPLNSLYMACCLCFAVSKACSVVPLRNSAVLQMLGLRGALERLVYKVVSSFKISLGTEDVFNSTFVALPFLWTQCASASSEGQLILPDSLKLLPVYLQALFKHAVRQPQNFLPA